MWQYVETFHSTLYAMCKKAANGNTELADELMSDVVYERLPRIIELHDPAIGPLTHYVNKTLRFYLFKHMQLLSKQHRRFENIESEDYYIVNHDPRLEVLFIEEHVTPYEFQLLWSHYALGISIRELSTRLDISRSTLTKHIRSALEKAKSAFPSSTDDSS